MKDFNNIMEKLQLELDKLNKLKDEVRSNTEKLSDTSSRDEFNDGGSNLQIKNQNKSVLNGINNSIEAIEKAIEDIKKGEYGICEVCKKDIPVERLEIKPWSRRCVRCI